MSASATILDRAAIEARLPHRAPFLFLDRVVGLEAGAPSPRLTAEWRVPPESDFFRGHFPGNPVTPGVILCEHAFQAAAVLLCELGQRFGATRDVPLLARIEKAKFRRIVRPGETLVTTATLVENVARAAYLEAKAAVDGETALEVRCVLSRGPRPEGDGAAEGARA